MMFKISYKFAVEKLGLFSIFLSYHSKKENDLVILSAQEKRYGEAVRSRPGKPET